MALTVDQISDLVYTTRTLPNLRGKDWTNLMASLQEYVAMPMIFKNKKKKVASGRSVEFLVQYQSGVNARMTGLYDTDQPTARSTTVKGEVPWRFADWQWTYDIREDDINGGREQIIDFVKTREAAELQSAADLMEAQFFGAPSSSSDLRSLFGLFYWIPYVTGTPSFQGGDPSGFTGGAAGLPVATYPRYQNWSGSYTNVTKDDLIDKMKDAAYKTNFKSPIGIPEAKEPPIRRMILTNYDRRKKMETLGEAQNENLGFDLDKMNDKMSFQGIPVTVASYLDGISSPTANPVIGIDWETFYPVAKEGWWMRKGKPVVAANQRNVLIMGTDCIFNIVCDDRRRQWILGTT